MQLNQDRYLELIKSCFFAIVKALAQTLMFMLKNPQIMKSYFLFIPILFCSCMISEVESEIQDIIDDVEDIIYQTVTYEVNFMFDWNSTDFPCEYPSSAHFSPLVGWVHEKDHPYFKEGEFASSGIE